MFKKTSDPQRSYLENARCQGVCLLALLLCAWASPAVAQPIANWLLCADNSSACYNTGSVGIGTTTPDSKIHIVDAGNAGFRLDEYGAPNGAILRLRHALGTVGSPGALTAGSAIFSVRGMGYYGSGFGTTVGGISLYAAENFTSLAQGSFIAIDTTPIGSVTPTERLRVSPDGNVGIGTITPATKLHVIGDATFTGNVTGGNIQAKYQDLAEWVPSSRILAAGTVVVLDTERPNSVVPSFVPYDTRVAGVVSDRPGVLLGEEGEGKVKVATTGRVKVRVRSDRPVAIGDLLVTGEEEGMAMVSSPVDVGGMKLHRPGTLIGKALEPMKAGTGEVLALLSLQ